ncbi:MAG: flagellar motor switch protein FliN [Verrucomicrobiota bacterium]|jgi:flagellar motor switch protein FliN/FliY
MAHMLEEQRLKTVMDVKVQLTIRLGSCQLAMRDVLELSPGSIVQLNQRANDPIGLYINDKLIALGEVVVVEENFAIKVTQLIGDPA